MSPARSRRYLYAAFAFAVLLIAAAAASWFAARFYGPEIARRIEAALEEALGRPAAVEKVVFRLWLGQVGLRGLSIAGGPTWDSGTMLRLGRAEARLGIASLWRRELLLSGVLLEDLDLRLAAGEEGAPAPLGPIVVPRRFAFGPVMVAVESLRVRGGRIVYEDRESQLGFQINGLNASSRFLEEGASLSLSAEELRLALRGVSEEFRRVSADALLSPDQIAIQALALRWQGREIRAAGRVAAAWTEPEIELDVRGEVSLAPLGKRFAAPWPVEGLGQIKAALRGPLQAPSVSAELVAPRLALGPVSGGQVAFRGEWREGVLDLTRIGAELFGGRLEGSLRLVPTRPSDTRAHVKLANISAAALESHFTALSGLRGTLNLETVLRGDPAEFGTWRGHALLEGAGMSWPGKLAEAGAGFVRAETLFENGVVEFSRVTARWPGMQLNARGRLARGTLRVTEATIIKGNSRVSASGSATWRGSGTPAMESFSRDLRFEIEFPGSAVELEDLRAWLPRAVRGTGRFFVSGRVEGAAKDWQGSGRLKADSLAPAQVPMREIRADFDFDPEQLVVRHFQSVLYGVPVRADGAWDWKGSGRAAARLGPVKLADVEIPDGKVPLDGTAQGRLNATVRGGEINASGTITMTGVSAWGAPLGRGAVNLELKGERFVADFSFAEARLSGSATGTLDKAGMIAAQVKAEELDLDHLVRRGWPGAAGRITGSASAQAVVNIPVSRPGDAEGTLRLHPARFVIAGEPWESAGPIVLRWQDRLIHVERLQLRNPAGLVTAAGTIKGGSDIDLKVGGSLTLTSLPAFYSGIREAAGSLEVNGLITGTLVVPRFAGEGRVREGRLLLRDYAQPLRDLRARFVLSPHSLRLDELFATLGGGTIRAAGELALREHEFGAYRVTFGLRRVAAEVISGLQTVWDADLELVGTDAAGQLRGEARLVRGSYTRDLTLLAALPAAGGGKGEEPGFVLPLQVAVKLQDNLIVRNRLTRLRLGGNLSLEGTTASPVLFGELRADQGHFMIRKNRFDLTAASARFTDPLRANPFLEIAGRSRIQNYDVTVRVSGYADDLTVLFSSTPPLPQEDLLALAAFGVTREEFGRSGTGLLVSEAAQFLVHDLLGVEPGKAGLDVLEVQRGGEDGATVRMGKRLTERALVVFSQTFGDAEERRLRVEYQLVGPLLLAGEQNFRGGFSGDLVLRLRFR